MTDVRFKNSGLDSIEVQDNGHGIAPADHETIGEQTLARTPAPHY